MLLCLHIRNFAIIDEVEIEFGEGLNILTGETGAGKSILIGSISAALGGKISKDVIGRHGDTALIELTFEAPCDEHRKVIEDMGFYPEDGVYIISRKISAGGRSVSRINGETVTVSEVKELAMLLMSVHGQGENQNLLKASRQLELVDEFGGEAVLTARKDNHVLYEKYRKLADEKDSAVTDSDRRLREMDYLRFSIDEIESAALRPCEDEELRDSYRKLSNSQLLAEALSEVVSLSGDDDGCASLAGRAVKRLSKVVSLSEDLSELLDSISQIEDLLSDFNRDVADYLDGLENSEEELVAVQTRLDLIERLKSKYGSSIEDILAHAGKAKEELAKYEDYENYLAKLEKSYSEAEKELEKNETVLSRLRAESAEALSALIRGSMEDLNFGQSKLEIEIATDGPSSANGRDSAEIMVSLNPGEPLLPLNRVASGGELSRIMLAIKSVFAGVRDTNTLIFDEIDAGISGRTAQMVSEKLITIARTHQVICITHLPQIAAMADSHFVIEKVSESDSTRSMIRKLDENEQVDELARLTGGAEITDNVRASAREMKELAGEKKKLLQ